jgi:hypothetical protein
MSLTQLSIPVPTLKHFLEYVRVVDAGEYGFYAEHVTPLTANSITIPVDLEGVPRSLSLEQLVEQAAIEYACLHSLPCFFCNDPDSRWAELAMQQYIEQQEFLDATHRAWGWP